jgi:hypothetical protein
MACNAKGVVDVGELICRSSRKQLCWSASRGVLNEVKPLQPGKFKRRSRRSPTKEYP